MKTTFFDFLRRYTWFYRRYSPHELAWAGISFSQHGEDKFLEAYFFNKSSGFYVDVGGFHPYMYSNTYLFYRRGWHGINIEPNPASFPAFQKYRKRDLNLQLAISGENGVASFSLREARSGINDHTYAFKEDPATARTVTVGTRRLSAVLEEHLPDECVIDFMSVDCEGHDRVVLESNDWSRFRPRLVLCEALEETAGLDLNEYMACQGYAFYCRLHITNVYLEKKEWAAHLPVGRHLV
jgi:FkbM family methyltransferase